MKTEMALVVEEERELMALHKAMHDAKFLSDVGNPAWESPFVAAVANRLVDALSALGDEQQKSDWRAWRIAHQDRFEWGACVRRASAIGKWRSWDETKKRKVAVLLFSPLQLTEDKIVDFLNECDSIGSKEE